MKHMYALCLAAFLLIFMLTGCGQKEPSVSMPVPTAAPPASEPAASASQGEISRSWTEEEVLELYEAERKENWEMVGCVTFPDQASGLVGAVLFQDSDTQNAGVAFLGADGVCRMGGPGAPLADEPELEYLGDGAVAFKVKGEDGKVRSHTLSITIEGVDVTFKSVDGLLDK